LINYGYNSYHHKLFLSFQKGKTIMIDKLKDEEHDLFQTHMKDVTPLKKTKIIPSPKPRPLPLERKTQTQTNTQPLMLNHPLETNPVVKKIQPRVKFKPGISLSISSLDHPPITAEAILEFGLQHLSLAHKERLKKGQLQLNARIDLHGQNRIDALDKLERFLAHAHAHHNRNLLIIHGKGAKHGDTPILKQEIYYYLIRHAHTLALRSALPKHGGSGAIYLILKKPQNS
jgi:DNA-nicking Smr family endonuclease